MKRLSLILSFAVVALLSFQTPLFAQCGDDPIAPASNIPFDELIEVIDSPGVVYLSLINGDTPKPNECGLNPSNPATEWVGWGGPLDHDNMSIGEGVGTRNLITIQGVRCERGIGTHAIANFVYDLTGENYKTFHALVGADDETDACLMQFVFSIDDVEVYKSEEISQDMEAEIVDFDIPNGAKELHIYIDNLGADSCDHGDLGDARLMTAAFYAVNPAGNLAVTWGSLRK